MIKKKDGRGRPHKDRGPDYVRLKDVITPDCTGPAESIVSHVTDHSKVSATGHHSITFLFCFRAYLDESSILVMKVHILLCIFIIHTHDLHIQFEKSEYSGMIRLVLQLKFNEI